MDRSEESPVSCSVIRVGNRSEPGKFFIYFLCGKVCIILVNWPQETNRLREGQSHFLVIIGTFLILFIAPVPIGCKITLGKREIPPKSFQFILKLLQCNLIPVAVIHHAGHFFTVFKNNKGTLRILRNRAVLTGNKSAHGYFVIRIDYRF